MRVCTCSCPCVGSASRWLVRRAGNGESHCWHYLCFLHSRHGRRLPPPVLLATPHSPPPNRPVHVRSLRSTWSASSFRRAPTSTCSEWRWRARAASSQQANSRYRDRRRRRRRSHNSRRRYWRKSNRGRGRQVRQRCRRSRPRVERTGRPAWEAVAAAAVAAGGAASRQPANRFS